MAEHLRSIGLDVGTTTTQLIVSELDITNQASAFSVPELEITQRRILYRSPVYFTPLLQGELVDGAAIRNIVETEYQRAGITKDSVDTGAVIITGETSRKENARAVLHALSDFAGDFVVATAGPDLESILAAKGAGAVDYSQRTGKTLLHMDIGGGTSNLALIEDGKISATGCMNVGGRLIRLDEVGRICYISPVVQDLFSGHLGQIPTDQQLQQLADILVSALEMVAGLRPQTDLFSKLWTVESSRAAPHFPCPADKPPVISFSGGVADCIAQTHSDFAFADLGPILGRAIRRSRLCQGEYHIGTETIGATVIGAGSHSAQLSGSTVFHQNIPFPLKNLPVVKDMALLSHLDNPGILALPGLDAPTYEDITRFARQILTSWPNSPIYLGMEGDMAKALGGYLALHLPKDTPILCIDRVRLEEGHYLDVGAPVSSALPVVVKTLILGHGRT